MATQAVTVRLGGKERTLKYTLRAVSQIGERLGIKLRLNHLDEDLTSTPLPLSALEVILWAGLIHEDKDLKPEQVGEWVDQDNMKDVLSAFFSLFGARLSETARASVERTLGVEAESLTPT